MGRRLHLGQQQRRLFLCGLARVMSNVLIRFRMRSAADGTRGTEAAANWPLARQKNPMVIDAAGNFWMFGDCPASVLGMARCR